jgi:hypothetical protein
LRRFAASYLKNNTSSNEAYMSSCDCTGNENPKLGSITSLVDPVFFFPPLSFPLCTVLILTSHFSPSLGETGGTITPVWGTFQNNSYYIFFFFWEVQGANFCFQGAAAFLIISCQLLFKVVGN